MAMHDNEMVEVEVRPGKPFRTILKKDKRTRTVVQIPPGGRFTTSRRAARAFADKLKVVKGGRRPKPAAPIDTPPEAAEGEGPPPVEAAVEAPAEVEAPAATTDDLGATESAAKLAAEIEVDLANVKGTGAGGRILVKDVKAAAA